jgi:programmed cell death protein 4
VRLIIDDGSLYEGDNIAFDEDDPNYDSEEETGNEFIPTLGGLHREDIAKSKMTLTTYKKTIEPPISELFVSGDFDEIARTIFELEAPEYSYEFVKRLVNMSFDKTDKERELVSQLLSALCPDVLSSSMVGKGFERLFEIVDEIEKDAPLARSHLATYLARAVLDEVIPPSFLGDSVVCNLGGEIVDQAKILLSRDHGGARLEKSWGPGDGRPVQEMKIEIDQCMQEYLISGDIEEACRCIAEMNAPFFAHEVVKRAIINALDRNEEKHKSMSNLLTHMFKSEIISPYQVSKGFEKLANGMQDLVLDTPGAAGIISGFEERARNDGLLTPLDQ